MNFNASPCLSSVSGNEAAERRDSVSVVIRVSFSFLLFLIRERRYFLFVSSRSCLFR